VIKITAFCQLFPISLLFLCRNQ